MKRVTYHIAYLIFWAACSPTIAAQPEPPFQLDKVLAACGEVDTDTASYRQCLGKAAKKLISKMKNDVLCSKATCLVRLECKKGGNTCGGGGYSVLYGDTDTGHTIKVHLPSGKVANYFRCGSCSGIEPDEDDPVPLRLLDTDSGLVLEIPVSEHSK